MRYQRKKTLKLPNNLEIYCKDTKEVKIIQGMLKDYLDNFDLKASDFADLQKILNFELDLYRENLKKEKKNTSLVIKLTENIDSLKKSLGVQRKQIKETEEDPLAILNDLRERIKETIKSKELIGTFTWVCPSCNKPNINEVPHFAFRCKKDPYAIWNEDIMELVRQRRLTIKEAAKILQISPIGVLAICYERGYSLWIDYNLDKPETLEPLINQKWDISYFISNKSEDIIEKVKKEIPEEIFIPFLLFYYIIISELK